MPLSVVYLRHRRPVDFGVTPGTSTINRRGRDLLRRFGNVLMGCLGGTGDAAYTLSTSGATEPAYANAALSLSGASGTVGGVVNGVSLTATAAGGDTATAGLIVAAINASTNALVQGLVTASNLSATVTCASVAAGDTVNFAGFTFTATSGVTPSGVSGQNLFAFDVSGNDSADATALAAAINAAPVLQHFVFAIPVAAVVRIFSRTAAWPSGPGVFTNILLTSNGTRLATSGAALAASALVGVSSTFPGVQGNTITFTATGTGVTVLNTETRLNRGAALANVLPITDEA